MKRVSKLFALLIAALSVALVSCNKDGSSDNFYVSYGVIVGTQDAYTIKTDGGNTLTVKPGPFVSCGGWHACEGQLYH